MTRSELSFVRAFVFAALASVLAWGFGPSAARAQSYPCIASGPGIPDVFVASLADAQARGYTLAQLVTVTKFNEYLNTVSGDASTYALGPDGVPDTADDLVSFVVVDATSFNQQQLDVLANNVIITQVPTSQGIRGTFTLTVSLNDSKLSTLLQRVCSDATCTVNAASMSALQINVVDLYFAAVDTLSNFNSPLSISVDAIEVSGQTVAGTGTMTINSVQFGGTSTLENGSSDLRNIASTVALAIPSTFSISGGSSALSLRGNQLGSLSFTGAGSVTVDGAMGTHDLATRVSGPTLALANSSVNSGATVTLSTSQAANKTIGGAGTVAINSGSYSSSASIAGITANLSVPSGAGAISVGSGATLTMRDAQANGNTFTGAGSVAISGGSIGSSTSVVNITAAVVSPTNSFSVSSGATFTLLAAQANGQTIGGAGTTAISGNVDANADFTAISSALSIPGSVSSGATLTLTSAQGDGRSLGGAGSITIASETLSTNRDFRGLTTTGFAFSGAVDATKTLSINAVQSGGCAVSGAGSVDILCTASADTVSAGNISATVLASGLAGADAITSGAGADTLNGDAGDDTIAAGSGNDTVNGGDDNDSLSGGDGDDTINGGAGNDSATGGAGNDAIDGGTGTDSAIIVANLGSATFSAQSASSAASFTLAADGTDTITNVDSLSVGGTTVLVVNTAGSDFTSLDNALATEGSPKLYGRLLITKDSFTNGASYNALVGRIVAGSYVTVDATGMSATQLTALAGGTGDYVSIANLSIDAAQSATEIASLFGKVAAGSVVVNASGMNGDQKGALSTGISQVFSISSLALASSETSGEIANLVSKCADSSVTANAASMDDTQKGALSTAIAKISSITSLALASTEDETEIANLVSKCADESVTANAASMDDTQKGALSTAIAKISSITNLALASTESATEIANLASKCGADSATANAASMDDTQKGALSTAIAKISSITNLALASTEDAEEITNLASKCGADSVTANAASMDDTQKGALSTAIAKISSITNLALASTESETEIANLTSKCADASVTANAASMLDTQKGALSTAIAKISSITNLALASTEDATEIANLTSKCADASVTANAASMDDTQKGALSIAIAKISSITNLSLASTEDATEIGNLLGKTTGAVANATSMIPAQLSALGAGASSIAVDGITGTLSVTSAVTSLDALLGKTAVGATVNVDGTDFTTAGKATLSTHIAKVDAISNLSLNSDDASGDITNLLTKSSNAVANATGMTSAQLNALAGGTSGLAASGITGTFTVDSSITSVANLMSRVSMDATVTLNLAGMSTDNIAAANAALAYFDSATGFKVSIVRGSAIVGYQLTIQAGIDYAAAGDIVDVLAGTYAEAITISKAVDVRGPNYAVSPNGGTRSAEAIIVPATSDPANLNVVTVSSSGVTFRGFTVDGDNTALAAAGATDPAFPSATLDASRGLFCSLNGLSNTLIEKNIVRNVVNGAIRLQQATNQFPTNSVASGTFANDNLVNDNLCQNCNIGVDIRQSGFAGVTNNTVINGRYGIYFGDCRIQNKSAAAYKVISGNTLAVREWGMWFNLYRATPYAVSNNTITAVAEASRTEWFGVMLANVAMLQNFTSQNLLPLVATPEWFTFTNNTIDGSGVDAATTAYGYWGWALDNGRDTAGTDHFTQITGGSVSNVAYGISLRNVATSGTGSGADSAFGTANTGAHAEVSGVAFSPKAGGTGFFMLDSSAWTASNPAPIVNKRNVQLAIGAGNSIAGGATGMSVTQPSGLAAADYNPIVGGTVSNLAFSGQSGDYIALAMNKAVDATSATFGGSTGAAAAPAANFATANKITDKLDNSALGRVTVKANNLFIPSTNSVAAGIALVAAGEQVNVQAGTYADGAVTVNANNLTVDSEAGVSGYSFTLGSAANLSLAGSGDVNADGSAAANILAGSAGINTLNGLAGADTISGGDSADTLNGGDDADSISGNAGDDAINGGNGNDSIDGGAGADAIDGGSGIDSASYGVTYVGALSGSSTLSIDGDTVQNVENIVFSDATVAIVGRGGSEYAVLNDALSASGTTKLWGNLAFSSTTVGFTNTATLNAILARIVDGSTVSVNYAGMSAAQIAAVNANLASFNGGFSSNPVTIVRAASTVGYAPTIASGVEFASSGDTLNIAAGTYSLAQMSLSKSLSFVGAGATTVIAPAANVGDWIVAGAGTTVSFTGMKFDGTGRSVTTGIYFDPTATGSVANCTFDQIKGGGIYDYGCAVKVGSESGGAAVDISGCTFANIGRTGIRHRGTGSVSGNTYTGKGSGDWLDYFILAEYGSDVVIDGNTVTACTGVALVDGSTSSAIAVWDDFNTTATITNNILTGNTAGVGLSGINSADPTWSWPDVAIGTGNVITGGDYGVSTGSWYGAVFSPTITFGSTTLRGQAIAAIDVGEGTASGVRWDISSVIFKNAGGTTLTSGYAIENSVNHAIDATGRALLMWNAGNLYVTNASGSVARAVALTLSGETVHVDAGSYSDTAVTINTANLTVDSSVGANGYSLALGSANSVIMAGAGDLNTAGNANGNSVTTNDGANSVDGNAGIDTAVFSSAMPTSLVSSSSIAVGTDTVTDVERLQFSDGTIALVGVAGSEYTTLNQVLALNGGEKLFGILGINKDSFTDTASLAALQARVISGSTISVDATGMNATQLAAIATQNPGNVSNVTITYEVSATDITSILAQTSGAIVDMASMGRDQTAAVNGSLNKVATVNNSKVRVTRAASVINYNLYVDDACAVANAGDTVNVDAGSYALISKIEVDGYALVGAGVASVTIDMSAAPMSTTLGAREQGILLSGDGASVSGFTLTSPTRTAGTGSAYGIKAGNATNIAISNVKVTNVALSAVDLNSTVGATVSGLQVDGVSGGWGLALSGSASDIAVSDLTVANAAWGDAMVQNYAGSVPTGVTFSGTLAIGGIGLQGGGVACSFSTGSSSDAYYNASANVFVPAAFNRTVSYGAGATATSVVVRQGNLAALQAYLAGLGVPTAAQTVANILGPVETVRGGFAVSGKSVLNNTVVAALASGDVVQMNVATTGGTVALTSAFPSTSTIVGTFSLTSASFDTTAVFNSVVDVSSAATRTVVCTNMSLDQVASVAGRVDQVGLANITDSLYAINTSTAAAFDNAFAVSGITPDAAYSALASGVQGQVRTDMVSNRSTGYASVSAADDFFNKLVAFRTAQQAVLAGASLTAADFASGARYPAVASSYAALPSGTSLDGEDAALANTATVITQFNALTDGGRGEAYVLAAMNDATGSISAKNTAFANALETAQAYDALDAGLTSANDASNITYLLGYSAANATYANATGMGVAQLNALAGSYGKLALNGITGTVAITNGVTSIGNLLSRVAAAALVSVDMTGMNATQVAEVNANLAVIDTVTGAPVSIVRASAIVGYQLTVQAGINYAAAGDIVNVSAGTYAENITIAKALDVRGPNYAVSPNGGARSAEAILVPASTNTSSGAVVTITSSGVSFCGFTVDGDNAALASSGVGLGGALGTSIDAARCIFINANGVNGITVAKNIAKNTVNGIRLEQTTNYFATTAGALRSYNILVDDNTVADTTGTGIRLGNSMYAKVTNNTVTNADNGIAFNSFRISDAGSAADRVIQGNTISARYAGIWVNLFHASPYALVNNTITVAAAATSMAPTPQSRTAWYGIMYSTVSAPQNFTNQVSLPLVATPEWWTATGNTIDGVALESTSTGHGYWLYYVDNNRDSAGNDHFGQISGGSVSNVAYGIMLKNKDTDPATNFGNSAVGAHAAVSGTAFSLNAGGTGFRLIDDAAWVTSNPAPLVNKRNVQLSVGAGNSITGGATGVSVTQPFSFAQADYNPIVGGTISDLAFSGQSGDYILLAMNKAVDATSASFGGANGATASNSSLFDVEDKLTDKLDNTELGLVRLKASNVFVSATGNIGRGITAASTGDTVNVAAGTYSENLTIAKRITLSGAGSGVGGTSLVSAAGAATPVISVTGSGTDASNQLVISNVGMVGSSDTGGSDAIAVYGDTPVSFVKVDNVSVSTHGVGVHYRTGTISNVTVSNSTLSGNGFGVRVATAVTSMDGMTIDGCTMNGNNSSAISTNPSGTTTNVNTNFVVSNSTFTGNGTSNLANMHDLSFFGFHGNAALSNVTVTAGNGTAKYGNGYGIMFTNGSGRAALGTVSLSNVTVQGFVGKGALTFQLYNDVSGVSMSGVSLKGCVAPWGDLIVDSTGAAALNAGDTALKSVMLWNAGGVNATGASFYASTSASTAYDRAVLADNFSIANAVGDVVDAAGLGLVRTTAGKIYVSSASAAGLYRAIGAASAGDVIVIEDGAAISLTTEITASVTFSGNFTITSANIPTGSTATAVLSSFASRLATGSTLAVNLVGMSADQIAAVNANLAYITSMSGNPVTISRGGSTVGFAPTIQAGIDYASAGDTITVAAGTYAESLDVTKSLTLRGANAGINPNSGIRGAETVIQSALASSDPANRAFQVRSGNQTVTIDGFKIVGGYPLHDGNEGGFPRTSDVTFSNNIAEGCNAIFSGTATSWDEVVVSGNKFVTSNATATTSAIQLQTPRVATVSGNAITNAAYAAVLLDGVDTATVSNNVIDGTTVQAIQLANVQGPMGDTTISGNTISNANSSLGADRGAIRLYGSGLSGTTTITNNTISASHNGIAIKDGSNITGKVINLSGNTITVGTGSSVYHGGTGELNFTGANTVNGVLVSTASTSDLFAVSATVSDAMDVSGKGLVRLKAANLYAIAGGNIGLGIAAASTGDTVNVAAGTYTENLTIAKRITLSGAGSGVGGTSLVSAAGAATPVISVTGSGTDASNQLVISNVGMVGSSDTGGSDAIAIYGDTPVSFVKVDNVSVSTHGVGVHYRTGTISNVTVSNSTLSGNGFGVRVASAVTSMDGMTIDGCTMNGNNSSAISTNPSGTTTNVNTNFVVSNSTFTGNGTSNLANMHDLSFFGFHGNAALSNVTVTAGNGTAKYGNGYGIVFTNGSGRAALGTVSLSNVTVQGFVGKGALTFQLYNDVSGVSMSGVSLKGCVAPWGDLIVDSTGAAALNAGDTALKSVMLWNAGGVNATGASFYSSTTASSAYDRAVLADNFSIANAVGDVVDAAGLGLVRTTAGKIYVSAAAAAGALERAIGAASAGDEIVVQDGAATVLTTEITKSVTFSGNFTITSTSIPTGSTATAVLSSFYSRLAAGSTITVNAAGMSTDQLAAVATVAPGSVTGVSITSAQTASTISSLLAQTTGATVDMAGMERDQTAAVNAGLASVATVNNSKVRVTRGTSVINYNLFVDDACAVANAGDTVNVDAGSYALISKIEVDGYALVGAGVASVTIDMSAAPMSTTLGAREQGILLTGDRASVSGFTLTSPTRTAGTGSAYGIKAGNATNIAISNVKVTNVALSAVDLNSTVGATVSGLQVDGVSGGWGLALSGSASDIAVSDLTVANAAWGDAMVQNYAGSVPTGVTFSGTLAIGGIGLQGGGVACSFSTGSSSDAYYNASANVFVPAAFNRTVSYGAGATATSVVVRQGNLAALQAYLAGLGVPTAAQTVANILGPVETVRGGFAVSGKSVLNGAVAAALASGDVVQMNVATTGGTVALGASAFPASSTIVGTFSLTSTSFDGSTALDSVLAASGTASRTVVMTDMNATQVHAVALQVDTIALANIVDSLYAINAAADASGMGDAFAVSGITPDAAYSALTLARQTSVGTDMVNNRSAGGYESVSAADAFFTNLVAFRTAQQAVIDGAALTAADFGTGARYPAVASALAALPAGTTLDGETSAAYDSATVITQFNALVVGGRGRTNSLNAMNSNDTSISAMNTAFAAALETSQAYDALDAGLTSANSASNITYLLGFSAANATNANAAGMGADQLTSLSNGIGKINAISSLTLTNAQSATEIANLLSRASNALATATGMNAAKLSALGAGYLSIAADGITGTLAIDVHVTDLGSLLSKTAVGATVNVDAAGFDAAGKGTLASQISKVDTITNLALASSEDADEIAALLTKATDATADATGMGTDQLNALSTGYASLAANGITGTFTIDSAITDVASLLSRTSADATVSVNLAGMTTANIAAVNANLSLVDSMSGAPVTITRGGSTVGYQLTIQTGIDYATAGDVVSVAAGTYTEQFTINKAVTVQGPNADVAGSGTRSAEAVLDYSNAASASQFVLVSQGSLKGFKIVDSNLPTETVTRVSVAVTGGSVSNNLFFRDSGSTAAAGSPQRLSTITAVSAAQSAGSSATISGNYFTGSSTGVSSQRSWSHAVRTSGNGGSVSVSGNLFDYAKLPMTVSDDLSALTIDANTFNGVGVDEITVSSSTATSLVLGTNDFNNPGKIMVLASVPVGFEANIASSHYNGSRISGLALSGQFAVAAACTQSITDSTKNGLVRSKSGNVYVPATAAALAGGISRAISVASVGDTVNVDAGSYSDNLNVSKRLTLDGAGSDGSGTNLAAAAPATSVVTISGSGSVDGRLTVKDMRLSGSTVDGIRVDSGSAVSNLTFDNIVASGMNNGVHIAGTTAVSDVVVSNSTLSSNTNVGLRVATACPSLDGLAVSNCTISSNGNSGFSYNPSSGNNVGTNFSFTDCTFATNNTSNTSNAHDLSFFAFVGNASLTRVTVNSSNLNAYGIAFTAQGLPGYASNLPAGNISLTDVTVSGAVKKNALSFQYYSTVSGISLSNVDLSNCSSVWGYQLSYHGSDTLNAGNTTLKTIDVWSSGGVDARNVVFKSSSSGSTLDSAVLADAFQIENQVQHKIDLGALGLCRVRDGHLYVTTSSFYAPYSTIAGSLERAIAAATAGDEIHVQDGVGFVLTSEITASVTFSGTFVMTKDNFPSGATADAVLNSFLTRGAVGSSTFSAVTSGMSADQLNAVSNNYAYFNGGVGGGIYLTSAQSATQINTILGGAPVDSALADATDMTSAQLDALASNASKLANNGVTGTMLVTSGSTDSTLSALLAKTSAAATVNVDGTAMTATALSAVASNDSKIDEISNLSLANAQSAAEITTLLGKSVAAASTGKAMAVANATSMDAAKLNALGASYAKLADEGITGSVSLVAAVTDANMTNLFVKIALAATVRADGTGMGASTLAVLSSNIAKVDSAFAIALTSGSTATVIANVLGVSDAASAAADATGMDSNVAGQLAKLADNYTKIANNGITGAIVFNSNLTPTQITNLLSKANLTGSSFVGGTTVTVNASGMTDAQLTALAAAVASAGTTTNQAAVFDLYNLSLGASQTSSELATLLNATTANGATVNATGMSSQQLAELGNYPASVDQITGTVTITADLTSAQIAAIMGNTSTTAVVNIDSNGMSPEQQAAVLSNAVMVVNADATIPVNTTFIVDIDVSGLSTAAVGVQARVDYDASKLEFVADFDGDGYTDSIGGTAMPTTVFVTPGAGYVSFATGVDIGGDGTGITTGNVAQLRFRALAPVCEVTDLLSLATSGFTNRITSSSATAIPFIGTNFTNVTAMNNLALTGVPSSSWDLPADAGTTAGAAVTAPTVTSTDSCGNAVTVVRSITLAGVPGTTSSWPARFPVGVSSITWTATDAAGNVATATRTVTVQNYQLATVDVNLVGGVSNLITWNQTVRVRMSSGDVVSAVVPFTGNNGAVTDVQVPVRDDYTCMSVKDAVHTVAKSQSISVSGTKYVAAGSFDLIGGDSNDDNLVDIFDFGLFVNDRGAGKNPNSRSNFDRNLFVNNSDFSYISLNFTVVGDTCGGGYLTGNEPRTRVSVKELRRAGLGELVEADINMDGWLDIADIELALQGRYRPDFEQRLDPADEVEVNW